MMTWQDFLINQNTEPEWGYVKAYRNMRLQSSDIAVIRYTEAGLPVPPEWVTYRQALRDITTTFPDPESVVFPDPPEVAIPPSVVSQEERLEAAELFLGFLLDQEVAR
jgi:hypothetical protein